MDRKYSTIAEAYYDWVKLFDLMNVFKIVKVTIWSKFVNERISVTLNLEIWRGGGDKKVPNPKLDSVPNIT